MEVSEVLPVVPDGIDDVALHDLHVVGVVEQAHGGTVDSLDDLDALGAGVQGVARMIHQGVQRLDHQRDARLLCDGRQLAQHGDGVFAHLFRGDLVGMRLDRAVLLHDIRHAEDGLCAQALRRRDGGLHVLDVDLAVVLIHHHAANAALEGGHRNADLLDGLFDGVDVLVVPVPEFNIVESGVLCLLKALQERILRVNHLNAAGKLHGKTPFSRSSQDTSVRSSVSILNRPSVPQTRLMDVSPSINRFNDL